jgi:hypothetical protein
VTNSLVLNEDGTPNGVDPVADLLKSALNALPKGRIGRIESDEVSDTGLRRIAVQLAPAGFAWPEAKVDEMLVLARQFPTFKGKTHKDAQAFIFSLLPKPEQEAAIAAAAAEDAAAEENDEDESDDEADEA